MISNELPAVLMITNNKDYNSLHIPSALNEIEDLLLNYHAYAIDYDDQNELARINQSIEYINLMMESIK